MGSVINQIQSMEIEVIHVPTGCTYLCQPMDVGINKPIKMRLTKLWEDWIWMTDGAGVVNGIAKEPPQQVAEWLLDVYIMMPEEIVRNTWKKEGMSGFKLKVFLIKRAIILSC